jgi:hypothetical protein
LWELIVHLIGTFGLAVFLVLYYVLVMQPREIKRYEELRRSVDSVVQIVKAGRTVLTDEQVDRLKELFIHSAAPELAGQIEASLSEKSPGRPVTVVEAPALVAPLVERLQEILRARARLLRGISRGTDGELPALFESKLRRSEAVERLAQRAITDWPYRSRADLDRICRDVLYESLRTLHEPS